MLKNCLQYILSVLKNVEGVLSFPGDTVVKSPPTMQETQETQALIPGLGRCPGIGNGNPLQYYCLENSMDRGAWRATGHGVTKSQTQPIDFHFFRFYFY